MARRVLVGMVVLLVALALAGCEAQTDELRATAEAAGEAVGTAVKEAGETVKAVGGTVVEEAKEAGATVETAGGTAVAEAGATVQAVTGDDKDEERQDAAEDQEAPAEGTAPAEEPAPGEGTEAPAEVTAPAAETPDVVVTGTVQVELPQVTSGGQPATPVPAAPAAPGQGGEAEQVVTSLWAELQAGDVDGALEYWTFEGETQPADPSTARAIMERWAGGGRTLQVMETSYSAVDGGYQALQPGDPAATVAVVEALVDGEPAIFSLRKTGAGWRVAGVLVLG